MKAGTCFSPTATSASDDGIYASFRLLGNFEPRGADGLGAILADGPAQSFHAGDFASIAPTIAKFDGGCGCAAEVSASTTKVIEHRWAGGA